MKILLRKILDSRKITFRLILISIIIFFTIILNLFGVSFKYTLSIVAFFSLCVFIKSYWPTNYDAKVKRLHNKVYYEKINEKLLKSIDDFINCKLKLIPAEKYDKLYSSILSAKVRLLLQMGARHHDIKMLKENIDLCEEVLLNIPKIKYKSSFFCVLCDKGITYSHLAFITNDEEYLVHAFTCYEELLKEDTKTLGATFYRSVKYKAGNAYIQKFYFNNNIENLNKALQLYEEVEINIIGKYDIHMIKFNLGVTCRLLYELTNNYEYKLRAEKKVKSVIEFYRKVIEEYPKRYFYEQYAFICFYMGICYSELFKLEKNDEDNKKAKKYLDESKDIFYSLNCQGIINNIIRYQESGKIMF